MSSPASDGAFALDTNVAELDASLAGRLARHLDEGDGWRTLATHLPGRYALSAAELREAANKGSPSRWMLVRLGNRGMTVVDLIKYLDKVAFVQPQLVLRRKFYAAKIKSAAAAQRGESHFVFSCRAIGFPYPGYEWHYLLPSTSKAANEEADRQSEIVSARPCFAMKICSRCTRSGAYKCVVANAIPPGRQWDEYRTGGRQHSARVWSHAVTIAMADGQLCAECRHSSAVARIRPLGIAADLSTVDDAPQRGDTPSSHADCGDNGPPPTGDHVAVDKVALVVANCEYAHLPPLATPACDAHALAAALVQLGFKTVALVDLTLAEMKSSMRAYEQLLGAPGVYAVFYFVGHGLETSGQCYLLPTDAPAKYAYDDCLPINWLLALMQQRMPSLNVVLLDMCRKQTPVDTVDFLRNAARHECPVNRNTVFGYATSSGGGAYEVKGETHGVFMKYLKKYLGLRRPVVDILQNVLRELEFDPSASHVQFPEINTTLSRPLSLADPIACSGHTHSFDLRTLRWQALYELPEPVCVRLERLGCALIIGFHYCGHFCNMLLAQASVAWAHDGEGGGGDSAAVSEGADGDDACPFVAHLAAHKPADSGRCTLCAESDVGRRRLSTRTVVRHLQRPMDALVLHVTVLASPARFADGDDIEGDVELSVDGVDESDVLDRATVTVPPAMIMRL